MTDGLIMTRDTLRGIGSIFDGCDSSTILLHMNTWRDNGAPMKI